MRPLGKDASEVFGPHDRRQEGLRRAIQGRDHHAAAGAYQGGQRLNDTGRIRDVLQHLHAGDGVIGAGMGEGVFFSARLLIDDIEAGLERV